MQSLLQGLISGKPKQSAVEQKLLPWPVITGAAIFFFVLLFTLAFHLNAAPPHRTLCFDARQYFFDTSRIAEFILSAAHGHWKPELVGDSLFVTAILSDGPAFPSLFAALFAVCGHVPGIQDCKGIEVFQSVMHAGSATLVYLLTFLFTRRIAAAAGAGLAWGFYPAAIYWSGIFYTETTVVFFSLGFAALLAYSKRPGAGFAAGIFSGMVALLKPALLPAAAAASLLSLVRSKRSFLLLLLGGALAIAPWMLYTRATTGHARFTAQRFPAFNLAMGADTEVDACFVSPAPPLTTMFSHDDDMPIAFPLSQWQYHTGDCLRLAAVKLSALWSKQTNDFRQSFLGISPAAQNLWHLFLLFSGITGMISFAFAFRSRQISEEGRIVAGTAIVFVLSHFCYVLFTPAARYGFTAMPFLVIFGAYAWLEVFKRQEQLKQRMMLGLAASLSAMLVLALVKAASLSAFFSPHEPAYSMEKGDVATRYIDFKPVKAAPISSIYSVLLLVDGDHGIENADIAINGHKLAGKLEHIRSFNSKLYRQSFELRSLGYPAGVDTDSFRHWRAVAVPAEFINWSGPNAIKLTAREDSIIYGEPANNRHMRSIDYFSVNNLCNSESSLELRIPDPILSGAVGSCSVLKKLSSHSTRKLTDALSMRLAVSLAGAGDSIPGKNSAHADAQGESGSCAIFAKTVSPKNFDLYIQDPQVNGLRANRINLKAARSMGTTLDLPDLGSDGMLRVKVEGDLRAAGKDKNGNAEVVVALQPARQNSTLVLNMTPGQIGYEREWRHFSIEDLAPRCLLADGKKHSLYIAVYPGQWLDFCGYTADKYCGDVQFRNLRVSISKEARPDFDGKHTLFY